MLKNSRPVFGALGVGLALYIVGSIAVMIAGIADLDRMYEQYMGVIWIGLSAISYPFVKRLLKRKNDRET